MSQDAWSSAGSRDDHDDTSDRMYTPEDLAEYAARRDARAAGGAGSRGPAGYGDPLTDPLTDPIVEQPADPAPYVAPAGMPTSPPPSSPPPSYQPPVEVVPVVPVVPAEVPVQ
ncbi:MAG: hypothetical protein JWN91_4417, partial [Nocardioides sp.]|nr:hypothetical protein [Nocardioides sp.]